MVFEVKKKVSLAPFTTLGIGGDAAFFICAENEEDVVKGLLFAKQNDLNVFILGGGSNVLISDEGFNGLVLQIALKGVESFPEKDGTVYVSARAGEDWDEFVSICVENNLQGVENLSGIPGLVGGTPVQNVGAYGQEVSETIVFVRVLDKISRQIKELTSVDCQFEYRKSIFNTSEKNRYIVLAVTYALKFGGKPNLVYADLKNYFSGKFPDLKEVRRAVCKIRESKSMLVRQKGTDSQSAGSFFKNPIVELSKLEKLRETVKLPIYENIPHYKIDDYHVKIPAAWLIEKSGFHKGYKLGNAGVSTKHTLALTNCGGASAREIINLKNSIQFRVNMLFGIELEVEPVFVGFDY